MKRLLLLTGMWCMMTAVHAQQITFTCIGGTDYGKGEGCQKAFDHSLDTKWGMYSEGDKFAVVELSAPAFITGYALVNANDNTEFERDIKEWEIFGTDDSGIAAVHQEDTEGWERFVDVRECLVTGTANYKASYFGINQSRKAYRYLMFKRVLGSKGKSQLSEITFSYTTQPTLRGGIRYDLVSGTAGMNDTEGFAGVFDEHLGTKYCGRKGAADAAWSVVFSTSEALRPAGYYFTTANDFEERDPRQWTIYASEDQGATWVTLDSKSNQEFPAARYEYRQYRMTSPSKAYNYFKIEFTENKNAQKTDLLQFGEFGFLTSSFDFTQNSQVLCYSGDGLNANESTPKLFDGMSETKRCGGTAYSTIFGVGREVSLYGYGLQMAKEDGAYDRRPKSWTLEGSNDRENWERLDQVTNDSKLAAGSSKPSLYIAYYILPKPSKAYKYFRYTLDATQGAKLFQLAEIIPLFQRDDMMNALLVKDGTVPVFNGVTHVKTLKYSIAVR